MKTKTKKKRQVPIRREVQILRFMRLSKGLSTNQAGRKIGIDGTAIVHIEHGRMALPPSRMDALIYAYGYTVAEFGEYLSGKQIPINLSQECAALLEKLDEASLKIVYGILQQFANR